MYSPPEYISMRAALRRETRNAILIEIIFRKQRTNHLIRVRDPGTIE